MYGAIFITALIISVVLYIIIEIFKRNNILKMDRIEQNLCYTIYILIYFTMFSIYCLVYFYVPDFDHKGIVFAILLFVSIKVGNMLIAKLVNCIFDESEDFKFDINTNIRLINTAMIISCIYFVIHLFIEKSYDYSNMADIALAILLGNIIQYQYLLSDKNIQESIKEYIGKLKKDSQISKMVMFVIIFALWFIVDLCISEMIILMILLGSVTGIIASVLIHVKIIKRREK